MFAKAVGVDAERFEASIFFALVNAIGKFPVGPVEVPTFGFEVFVLIGGGGIAVATCGEEEAENGEDQKLELFHYKSFVCTVVLFKTISLKRLKRCN
jgi:hypothetical protein